LIEARTYRMGPHNTSDDPTRYVDAAELEARRASDPIVRLRRYLTARGLVDEDGERALSEQLRAEVDAAVAEAEASAVPGPEAMFEEVYAQPPQRMAAQRAALGGEAR
jgi:pyruvate dehydrogenase E1 component alpha subunit